MPKYPHGRWSVSEKKVGASVWTRKLEDRAGEGGGYYLYRWERGSRLVTVEELVSAAGKEARQWPINERSTYALVGEISVPAEIRELDTAGQELSVARLMYADMRERFGEFAEWNPFDSGGRMVWFHHKVTGEN